MRTTKIILYVILFYSLISCNQTNFHEAKDFLIENRVILQVIVQQMYYEKNFTYLNMRKVNSDKVVISIEKSDSSYNFETVSKTIDIVDVAKITKEFCDKTKNADENVNANLQNILKWMLQSNIEIISMKTPEFNYLDVKIGSNGALRFQLDYYKSPDIITLDPIEKNWFFIMFK